MSEHWRFKTKKEFEKEYGPEWRKIIGWNFFGEMDYLCGTILPFDTVKKLRKGGMANHQGWIVRKDDIVPLGKYRIKFSWKSSKSPVLFLNLDLENALIES